MFERFPSLTRFSHDWTITEKIDGTNACIIIRHDEGRAAWGDQEHDYGIIARIVRENQGYFVYAQSRNMLIYPGSDNYGFAAWVAQNASELVELLGEGRHYGEWCGSGIQRGYGLTTKCFALFNTRRWTTMRDYPPDDFVNGTLTVVPVLAQGYMDNPGAIALEQMDVLRTTGSRFAPGFMNVEGVVMRHNPSGAIFKKTFDYDEQGKWAEKAAAKLSA